MINRRHAACCLLFAAAIVPTTIAMAADTRMSRADLSSVASAYAHALLVHDGAGLPLAQDVRRTENGLVNANGASELRQSFADTKMVTAIHDFRVVPDEAGQQVVAFYLVDISLPRPPSASRSAYKPAVTVGAGHYTVHEAERFQVRNGLITAIEIIAYVQKGLGGTSGWEGGHAK